jgi:hypothetical protein
MANKTPSPLQASFWLTHQEQRYLLVICALSFLGITARFYYLRNEKPEVYLPEGIEAVENHEGTIPEVRQ